MTRIAPREAGTAPLIVRMAGLPTEVVFDTDLGRRIERVRGIEERLATARQEMVDALYEAIDGAPKERRRFLLGVKRDCYNGRPLERHREADGWSHVEEVDSELAGRILDLEAELATWREAFEAAYQTAVREETESLVELLDHRPFTCGLALASPLVAGQCERLIEKDFDAYRRREKKLIPTLLRYVTRAALKLSPFSTFTPVGLGMLRSSDDGEAGDEGRGTEAVRLLPGGWKDSSLMRVRRYLLDQYWEMLHRYAPLREHLRVGLNDSRVPTGGGRTAFLRPSHWRPEDGELGFFEESLVRAGLSGPLVEYLETTLGETRPAGEHPTWSRLVEDLAQRLEVAQEEVAAQVDRLIEVGFLHLLPPWTTDEAHLEKTMLQELGELPVAPRLEPFLGPLGRLVELEDGILESSTPARDLREIKRLTEVCWHAAAGLAGLDLEERTDEKRYDLYQDVFRRPAAGPSEAGEVPTLAAIRRDAAEEAVRSVEPLARYTRLFDHRQDFLATLGAILARRAPDRSSWGLFEAFEAVQDRWQEYVSFIVEVRGSSRWGTTWNPLELPELEELDRFRRRAREAIHDCMEDGPDGRRIDGDALEALLDRAPGGAASAPGGTCLFLQPGTADGSLWVLNRLKEGTGRFASRYTPSMTEAERRRYTADIAERSVLELDGEPVELLDLQCIQGDTLNVHAPQTPRQLTLPGAASDLAPERRLTLGDLVIAVEGARLPRLRDRDGRRYLAAHLGVGYQDYMPTVLKFLCLFGPSEMGAVFPRPWVHRQGDLKVRERTVIGSVVIHRKSWIAPTAELQEALEGGSHGAALSDAEAFERLNRWRLDHGIPERVFLREGVPHPIAGRRYRPQFLDFSSPGLVDICRSAIESEDRSFTLVEMLPGPDAFPRDAEGRAWAVELLLDSIALAPPRPAAVTPSHHPRGWFFPSADGGGVNRNEPVTAHP